VTKESYQIINNLRLPHGLYLASPSIHYSYVWLRDSFYMSLPFLDKENDLYEKTYHRVLDLFRQYEWKIDFHTTTKPTEQWQYIHSRYSADTVEEIDTPWGHAQHDAIGAILFGIGEGIKRGKPILRDEKDRQVVQKIIFYLNTCRYHEDPDNGMWEEWREVHASSVGAVVAGLISVRDIVFVPEEMIRNGLLALNRLFPHESESRAIDLAQLSLIYPYNLLHPLQAQWIIQEVEDKLLRARGVARYPGDSYYSTKEETHGRGHDITFYHGSEAEWTFGLPWLALCHYQLGNTEKAKEYLKRTEEVMLTEGILPELYYSGTNIPNPNTPLGWSNAMHILAKETIK
jgi:phosphorylase kinase alpha/beta subunit